MQIKIPIKPLSVNRAWAGRRFKSAEYKQFTYDVCRLLPYAKKTIQGECEVHYTFYVKNYAMSDVDNFCKPITDLIISLGYIKDDRQIVFMSTEKVKCTKEEERIECEVIEY